MSITHTYLETCDILDSFYEYGWKRHHRYKNWKTKQLSFRQLKSGGMDESSLIKLFIKSPEVPDAMKRRFACICADRMLNTFRQYDIRERCITKAMIFGWHLAQGQEVNRDELRQIRTQTQTLIWALRCDPLYIWNVLDAIRAILLDNAADAALEAPQNAYSAIKRSMAHRDAVAEQEKQVVSIINLSEGKLVIQRKAPHR